MDKKKQSHAMGRWQILHVRLADEAAADPALHRDLHLVAGAVRHQQDLHCRRRQRGPGNASHQVNSLLTDAQGAEGAGAHRNVAN
eukprot:scaffold803_cov310-Pinguiococcus_pyrenoidosus.AAC.69